MLDAMQGAMLARLMHCLTVNRKSGSCSKHGVGTQTLHKLKRLH